jgi:hypothetical protein
MLKDDRQKELLEKASQVVARFCDDPAMQQETIADLQAIGLINSTGQVVFPTNGKPDKPRA